MLFKNWNSKGKRGVTYSREVVYSVGGECYFLVEPYVISNNLGNGNCS